MNEQIKIDDYTSFFQRMKAIEKTLQEKISNNQIQD